MPSSEALPSRRGRGPHHAQRDRVGSWDIPRLTTGHVPTWSASGRRGAGADDARTREVGLRHSSREADEQNGAIRCGAGGAKGGDQGECGPAKHVPDSEPHKRVTGAGTHTERAERFAVTHPRWEKLWGGRRRSWHLHRPYELMEIAPWPKSMISAEA